MNNKTMTDISEIAKRLRAMAETGLLFTKDNYDVERYEELKQISAELMAHHAGCDIKTVSNYFEKCTDYPTPKVDVRAVILNGKNEVLMVQEKCDNKWTLPGGWCEIGLTPKENIIKEVKEETGLDVEAKNLLAVFDKKCHPHPPRPHYVYKLVFYCICQSKQERKPNFEILDAQYFDRNNLPDLSKDRIVKEELDILFKKLNSDKDKVYFD